MPVPNPFPGPSPGRPEVRALLRILLAVLLLGAATTACSSSPGTGDKGYVDGQGVITRLAPQDRTSPGEISGTTLDGSSLSLKKYAGKVIVLNVWGSWCPPCRKEAGTLAGAARELASDGVAFVGVNTKDSSPDQGLAFQRRYDVPYPSFFDPAGRTLLAFHGTLYPSAIPSTVVLDKQGRVAASILGEVPGQQTLVDLVRDVQK
jgi:thiol-disulfide isomerase/thioredoxin